MALSIGASFEPWGGGRPMPCLARPTRIAAMSRAVLRGPGIVAVGLWRREPGGSGPTLRTDRQAVGGDACGR